MLAAKNNNQRLRDSFVLGKGEKLFQDNERAILKQIFWNHDTTQSRLADVTKTPQQTMSRLVKSLMEKGAVQQTEDLIQSVRGKPGYRLKLQGNFAYTFGLSVLLNAIAVAVMDFEGNVVDSELQLMDDMSIDNVLQQAQQAFLRLSSQHAIDHDRVLGLGIGISGFFSSMDGKMNTHHAIEEWAQIDIAVLASDFFDLPTWVVNDGTGAAAGEGIVGHGRKYKNFVYLFVSAAFGGGLVNDGEVIRGTYGNAGELGDMLPSKLYSHPNLELFRRIIAKHGVDIPSVYTLSDTYDPSWPGIDEWVYKVQDSFDLVATCSSALLDAQAIVIGGHIPTALAEKVISRIDVYAQFRRGAKRPLPEIVAAQVTHNPVAVGAATLPLRELCI